MTRQRLVAGNWKMHKTPEEAASFIRGLAPAVAGAEAEVLCLVPAVDLVPALAAAEGTPVQVGAQNMHDAEAGAFTGEISPGMLTSLGVRYVVIGHSERRGLFGEDDAFVNRKVLSALAHGLRPILCCGETLALREAGGTLPFLRQQVELALEGVPAEAAKDLVIAYEPIWAIGTGHVARTDQAQDACSAIRAVLREKYGKAFAETVRILYGGSVNAENAAQLFAQADIDGGLVGGASLTMDFAKIVFA